MPAFPSASPRIWPNCGSYNVDALIIAILFAPFSWLYRLGTWLDRRSTRTLSLPFPVVSVGNIALGGRAKTPFVIHLCRRLRAAGYLPVVLTRGYGRTLREDVVWRAGESADPLRMGDEATEIARAGAAEAILVGKRRAANAQRFLNTQSTVKPWVFVLDDGFQHWALARDVDIVIVSEDDLGNRVLPWGELREPPSSLDRAQVVLRLGLDLLKDTEMATAPSGASPLVLTTRAGYAPYLREMKKRFLQAESLPLRDHATREKILAALAGRSSGEVILGDKEAVKIFDESEYRTWLEHGTLSKKFAGKEKKFYRAFLRLTWQNEHATLQKILSLLKRGGAKS